MEAFKVTHDYIDSNAIEVGWCDDETVNVFDEIWLKAKIWHAYDDDGEHYFSGLIISDDGYAWDVIYEWAANYAGCTEIKDHNFKGVIG